MRFFSILLFLPIFSFSQISEELKIYVDSLSKVERYESESVGYGGNYSDVYALFFKASKIANDKEVEYLALNGNAIIKAYFSSEAIDRKLGSINHIFKHHLDNNEKFQRIYGCIGGEEDLISFMYISVQNYILSSLILKEYREETKWTEKSAIKKLREFNNIIKKSVNKNDKFLAYIIFYDESKRKKECKIIPPMLKDRESEEAEYILKTCNK